MKYPRAPKKRFSGYDNAMEFDTWKKSFLNRDYIPGLQDIAPNLTPQSLTGEEMKLLEEWYRDYYYFEEVGFAILEYRENNSKPVSTPKPVSTSKSTLSQLELF